MEKTAAGNFPSSQVLADAFSEFISASAMLEESYRGLQQEVASLNAELGRRNAALTRSLADNEQMRAALQQMLDSMPCGVLVLDGAERIVMMNPECRNLLELGHFKVSHIRDLQAIKKINFASLSNTPDDGSDRTISIETDSGLRWIAVKSRMLSTASAAKFDGALRQIWILRDVTAERNAELEREKARRTAVLAEISTILAHEIRNPLASMELFSELMEQEPENSLQWISNLRAGIRSLSGTVNNVLNLSSPNAISLTSVDLVAAVRAGVDFVRPIADQNEIDLKFATDSESLTIAGNQEAIQQIVLNITTNAIRHTASGGSVSVFVKRSNAGNREIAWVDIVDTGCGISEERIDKIFHAGFSGSGASPGLGLTVCKRFMERLGGQIRVSSCVDQGTTFQLEFPVR